MAKRKAILAGSTGFLGRVLLKRLETDYYVVPLVRDAKTGAGDLSKRDPAVQLPQADVLFHIAGLTTGRLNLTELQPGEINKSITENVIALCLSARIPRIVFASSYVYGIPAYLPVDETHPIRALSPYMQSKIDSERLLEKAARESGLDVIALRLFNPYGPGQRKGMLIPDILAQLSENQLTLGDDRPRRDFVHVDDVSEAFHCAASVKIKQFEAVNIASGQSYSVRDVVTLMLKTAHLDIPVQFNRTQRGIDIPDVVGNIQKAKTLLGWAPRIALEEGLDSLVQSALQFS